MSFSEKYLALMTECNQKLENLPKTVTFFGHKVEVEDRAEKIIRHSIEEYEDTIYFYFEDVYFAFRNDYLFDNESFNEDRDPSVFLLNVFKYTLKTVTDKEDYMKRAIAQSIKEQNIGYFTTLYITALSEAIMVEYREKYKLLKEEYPGLPFYPSFQFMNDESDYYESSTCW